MPPINPVEYEFIDECKDDFFHDLCPEPLVFLRECLEQTHEFLVGNRNFNIKKVTFIVKHIEGVAHTQGSDGVKEIHLSMKYIRNFATNRSRADTIYELRG